MTELVADFIAVLRRAGYDDVSVLPLAGRPGMFQVKGRDPLLKESLQSLVSEAYMRAILLLHPAP